MSARSLTLSKMAREEVEANWINITLLAATRRTEEGSSPGASGREPTETTRREAQWRSRRGSSISGSMLTTTLT